MTVQTIDLTEELHLNIDDDISHCVCPCSEDVALCGKNVAGHKWVLDFNAQDVVCVVCADLEHSLCPRCGE